MSKQRLSPSTAQLVLSAISGVAAILALYGDILAQATPVGLDGYYYVLQVEALLRDGAPQYPTPFLFPALLMTGVSVLVGDATMGIKIFALVIAAALSVAIFVAVRRGTGSAFAGALGQLIWIVHTSTAYYVVEYINNMFGLAMFALMVLADIHARQDPHQAGGAAWYIRVAAGGAAVVSHRMSAGLVLLYFAVKLLLRYARGSHLLALATWVLPLFTLVVMALQQGFAPPGMRVAVARELSSVPFRELFAPSILFGTVLLISTIVPIALDAVRQARSRVALGVPRLEWLALSGVVVLVLLNPWLKYDTGLQSIAARLRLAEGVFLGLLLPVSLTIRWRQDPRRRLLLVGALIVVVALFRTGRSPAGSRATFLDQQSQMLREVNDLRRELPQGSVIVAQHGFEYAITHRLGMDAVSGRESLSHVPADRVWWLLRRSEAGTRLAKPESLVGQQWMLVRDDVCAKWLSELPVGERSLVIGNNPFHLGRYLRYHRRDPLGS